MGVRNTLTVAHLSRLTVPGWIRALLPLAVVASNTTEVSVLSWFQLVTAEKTSGGSSATSVSPALPHQHDQHGKYPSTAYGGPRGSKPRGLGTSPAPQKSDNSL